VKVRNDSCVIHEYFRRLFSFCYDQYSVKKQDTETFGPGNSIAWIYSDESQTGSISYEGKITTYGGGGFYVDLPKNKTVMKELFEHLKENLWITRGTRAVFVDFTTFNANVDVFGVTKLVLEFPTSGGVIPSAEVHSVSLKRLVTAYDYFVMICEILIYVLVCFFIMEAIRDLVYFKLRYFKLFWSYIDWAIISTCIANSIFSILNIKYIPSTIESFSRNPLKYGNFEYFAYIHLLQNDMFAINLFFTYIKIFKYLNFNRTMGQLNNTLKKCAWDILGFSVMFFIIFFAFAQLGYLIFGSQVESFSSFGKAMFTLLRTILGDFDYPEIEKANRILAPIYFLSYIFLVFFVLLNMFLAIINDTYADVKTEIAIAPDEMQMTEYIQRGFFNMLRKLGCGRSRKSELKRELNITIRHIREALKKCGFSDLEIEMFFARYNIDPIAEVEHYDMEKLLAELEAILSTKKEGSLDDYVHVNDFVAQQERLEQIDKTISLLVTQVKTLLLKLEKMENVKKVKTT
ncbi:polycystic kidney disease 2-like 1 protein, partial [Anoplophora glabripennis]|uniref:polycystic kidney disease 2-like 1 protein n=1 Tax=Anoplophora glabripennis TaxID=217634 RepID=UPI000873EA1C